MGRTIPSWRLVVEAEISKLKKFQDCLPVEDQPAFHDLLEQCKLYAPYASAMASPIRELPLLISMLFGAHKKIIELEKKVVTLETVLKKNRPAETVPFLQTLELRTPKLDQIG